MGEDGVRMGSIKSKSTKAFLNQNYQIPLLKYSSRTGTVACLSPLSGRHLSGALVTVIWDPPPLQTHLKYPNPALPPTPTRVPTPSFCVHVCPLKVLPTTQTQRQHVGKAAVSGSKSQTNLSQILLKRQEVNVGKDCMKLPADSCDPAAPRCAGWNCKLRERREPAG